MLHTLSPIYIEDDQHLEDDIRNRFRRLQECELEVGEKQVLSDIFLSLVTSRFGKIHLEALKEMLAPLMDLKDTVVYKEILSQGNAEGMARGIEVGLLEQIRDFEEALADLRQSVLGGVISEDYFTAQSQKLEAKIAEKQKALEALRKPS